MRMGVTPLQNVTPARPGGANALDGHVIPNMYGHVNPFPNNSLIRPPFIGSSGVPNLSPVEAYRQHHEVTATVCILIHVFS